MGRPSATNRLRILQVHARDKPIDRTDDDAVLRQARRVSCAAKSIFPGGAGGTSGDYSEWASRLALLAVFWASG